MLMPASGRANRSDSFLPRNVYLWLSISALLSFWAGSVPSYGKGPSYKQTIDFIILKLSGDSGSSNLRCDRVRECRGSVDTVWQNRVAPSSSSCSIDIVQSIHVTYQREYHFRLDFGSIARHGISVEQATPESWCCSADLMQSVYGSDLPYAVHLTFTRSTNVSFQIKATGSGIREQKSSEQKGIDTWNSDTLLVGRKDLAERLARAFKHAATSCGAKEEVF